MARTIFGATQYESTGGHPAAMRAARQAGVLVSSAELLVIDSRSLEETELSREAAHDELVLQEAARVITEATAELETAEVRDLAEVS